MGKWRMCQKKKKINKRYTRPRKLGMFFEIFRIYFSKFMLPQYVVSSFPILMNHLEARGEEPYALAGESRLNLT